MEKLELLRDEKTGNYYLYNGALWYCSPMWQGDFGIPQEPFVEVENQDDIKKYLAKERS